MPKLDVEKTRELMKAEGLTKYGLSKRCGVTPPAVDYWFETSTVRAIDPISKALNVKPWDITRWD